MSNMKIMKHIVHTLVLILTCAFSVVVQAQESDPNTARNFGYVYWENGYPTPLAGRRPQSQANQVARNNPDLVVQTGYYSLKLDCDDAKLTGYNAYYADDYIETLSQDVSTFTTAYLGLHAYKNGVRYTCRSGIVAEKIGNKHEQYVRVIENGRYIQRLDHMGLIFTSDVNGEELGVTGRLEITAWPDRVVFHLDFEDVPGITRTTIHIRTPSGQSLLRDVGNDNATLAFKPQQNLIVNNTANVSSYITNAYKKSNGAALTKRFDSVLGAFVVEVPSDPVSWPADLNRVDEFVIEVTNPSSSDANVPLVFDSVVPRAITGTVMTLSENDDGSPTGIPVQISKNWHIGDGNPVHEGSWLRGSSMIKMAGNETREFRLRIMYGNWGNAAVASHNQLSLIGYGGNWKWDESALGAWGESMTYDPNLHIAGAFIADVRPSFTPPMKTTSTAYNWTENVGGGDFLIYYDSSNTYRWGKKVKTAYEWTGPNMTRVLYSGITDDDKIRFTYTTRLPSTNDYHRRFHHFKYEFLQNVTSPQRLVFYQMAADYYTGPDFSNFYLGNSSGLLQTLSSNPGGNTYKNPYLFTDRWLVINDTAISTSSPKANRGIIHRGTTLNGGALNVWMHTYGRTWGTDRMLFDLSSNSVTRSYSAGDVVEGEIEFLLTPKNSGNYWGADSNFASWLNSYAAPWQAVHEENLRNTNLSVHMHKGILLKNYPIEISGDTAGALIADFTIAGGGIGHVPIILKGYPKGYAVRVQRYSNTGPKWRWLESVNIGQNNYYQGYENADGTMDYVFSIPRTSSDPNSHWRMRILRGPAQ